MLEPRFCYEVSALAGLAHDEEGNRVSCYTQLSFEGGNLLDNEDYDSLHESLKTNLSKQLDIPVEWLKSIGQVDYDTANQED